MLLEKIKTTAKAYPQKLALVNPNFADSNITYAELDALVLEITSQVRGEMAF